MPRFCLGLAAEAVADWIGGAELHVIDGAGHWPQWERVEEFNRFHRDSATPRLRDSATPRLRERRSTEG